MQRPREPDDTEGGRLLSLAAFSFVIVLVHSCRPCHDSCVTTTPRKHSDGTSAAAVIGRVKRQDTIARRDEFSALTLLCMCVPAPATSTRVFTPILTTYTALSPARMARKTHPRGDPRRRALRTSRAAVSLLSLSLCSTSLSLSFSLTRSTTHRHRHGIDPLSLPGPFLPHEEDLRRGHATPACPGHLLLQARRLLAGDTRCANKAPRI